MYVWSLGRPTEGCVSGYVGMRKMIDFIKMDKGGYNIIKTKKTKQDYFDKMTVNK